MSEKEILHLAICRLEDLRLNASHFIGGRGYTLSEIKCRAEDLERIQGQYDELMLKLKGLE